VAPSGVSANENAGEGRANGIVSDKNLRIGAIVLVVVIAAAAIAYLVSRPGTADTDSTVVPAGPEVTTASGLKMQDIVVGTGASPEQGQTVVVHYVGTLEDGTQFDSSRKRGPASPPAQFRLGPGLIPAWNEALTTMKVGGKRKLFVPSAMGYGATGSPPRIPPNANLLFEIELIDVK
jgi:FKBP-type peptidyl-prolyl cis-trans isomerase